MMSVFFFVSCSPKKKEKQITKVKTIEKIVFAEINISEALNSELYKKNVIRFSLDSIALITKKYINKELVESKKRRSYYHSNKELFMTIPEEYLTPTQKSYLNYYPENDGEYVKVDIYINNDEIVKWTLSYNEEALPVELKSVYRDFILSKHKLYKE